MKRALLSFVAVLAFILSGAGVWAAMRSSEPPHRQARTARARPMKYQSHATFADIERVEGIAEMFFSKAHQAMIDDYLSIQNFFAVRAFLADAAARAAWVAAHTPPAPSQSPAEAPQRPAAPSGGDCSGFPIPSYIIQRESGGDPNAVNPSSGAYGCAQELPSHFSAGGACAGLNMYSVDGQRQCAYILSDGGTNLQPWAL